MRAPGSREEPDLDLREPELSDTGGQDHVTLFGGEGEDQRRHDSGRPAGRERETHHEGDFEATAQLGGLRESSQQALRLDLLMRTGRGA